MKTKDGEMRGLGKTLLSLVVVLVLTMCGSSPAYGNNAELKAITAVRAQTSPRIDGVIEPLWARADSATGFTQVFPNEGKPITEKTVVYVLYDYQNLYVAFKCYDSQPEKLVLRVGSRDQGSETERGDHVSLTLDSFNNKTTGYGFLVNAKEVQTDLHFSSGGGSLDFSWDGVWYSAAKLTDFGYVVEVKIPFRSIRFKSGLSAWGISFARYIARRQEWASWPSLKREELRRRLSKSGQLVGVYPGEIGLHLEIYPVALTRYDRPSASPDAGFDFSWYPTSSSSFHFTANPDFAQVEADPYQLNLSKYELYLDERRPFFTESAEIFKPAGGFELFYSRRIGKRLPGGKKVPILGGSKFTGKFGRFEVGAIGAATGETEYPGKDTTLVEPQSRFSVLRVQRQILENSSLGILYAGKDAKDDFNHVVDIDGAIRTKTLQLSFQGARAERKGAKGGYAAKLKFRWGIRSFYIYSYYENIDKDFDVSQVGFTPWRGRKYYHLNGGPLFYNKGIFREIRLPVGVVFVKEHGEPGTERGVFGDFVLGFTNNWGVYLNPYLGRVYEMGERFTSRSLRCNIWSDWSKPVAGSVNWGYNSRSYNYRGGYFAPSGYVGLYVGWQVKPTLNLGFDVNNTIELKSGGSVEKLNWILHPQMQYALRKDLFFRLWSEPNFATDIHRLNLLFSWNFMPKSWIYLAFNEFRNNTQGKMKLKDRIVVLKIRYLFLL